MPAMANLFLAVAVLLLPVQGLLAYKLRSAANATDTVHAEWDALKTWLTSNGATVSNKLQEAFTRHSGAAIRGVVTREDMQPGETILSIPRDLWFDESSIDFSGLQELKKHMVDTDDLPVSVALALEAKKGSTSKWAAYINHMPTLQDFESFYVRFASAELIHRFAPLDLAAKVGALQTLDEWEQNRFSHWNAKYQHDIEWDDVKLAMARWRTRNYFLSHAQTRTLMPVSDMLNTAPKEELNTAWDDAGDGVFEVQANASLSAGSELYESYCPHCKNDGLLHGWGIYFEQNPVKMSHKEVTPAFMRSVSKLLEAKPAEGMLAPRCKSSTLRESQGPILCAFARLAWETYAPSFLQLPGHASLRAGDTEEGLLQFNIRGMVH